jgi:hypothetical protein
VKFSQDYVLFCHITTRIQGEKEANLLQQKGGQGVPHIVFLDAEGEVIAVHEGDRTAESFSETGLKARAFLTLKAKADKGDTSIKVEYFIARLDLGRIKGAEAEKELRELGTLTPEQQAKVDATLLEAVIQEEIEHLQDKDGQIAAGRKFNEMRKAGKILPATSKGFGSYWDTIMAYAESEKDVTLFEEALRTLKEKYAHHPQAMDHLKDCEKRLDEIRKSREK